jgi:aerobic carbon-monoxide dehydrogenase medium subunit
VVRILRPTSFAQATRYARDHGDEALLISGGTALVLMMKNRLVAPDYLIDLGSLRESEFRGVRATDDHVVIGAGTSLADVAADAEVARYARSLAQACAAVGNTRVRNVATLGGNVVESDYASDPPAALVSLDAQCTVVGPDGDRTVAVADIITGYYETSLEPGEVVTSIRVPRMYQDHYQRYLRFNNRTATDRPCFGVALRLAADRGQISSACIVLGGVGATPHRVAASAELVGERLEQLDASAFARRALRDLDPINDSRATAVYRKEVAIVWLSRMLTDAAHQRRLRSAP